MKPFVSVVMPARNEAEYIEKCLVSILVGTYPLDKLEIIVCDGMSDDGTREIVKALSVRYRQIRLIENPKKIASTAMNLGIKAAQGEIIARADAHTLYDPDYIERCVELLNLRGADNVGGVQFPVGEGAVGQAIAIGTSSRFAAGDALFRYAKNEAWVDTVYLGCWRKATLERLGGFDETQVVNQDYELNYRLRMSGGRILLSPEIRCRYSVRPSLSKLSRQYYRYGLWKTETLVKHPKSLRWRQLVPPSFVAVLGLSCVCAIFGNVWLVLSLMVTYCVANIAFAFVATNDRNRSLLPLVSVVFFLIHVSWGSGFWVGVLRQVRSKFENRRRTG